MFTYTIQRVDTVRPLGDSWEDPAWSSTQTVELAYFRPEGCEHRPKTQTRLLCSGEGIHGIFRVEDRYVVCRKTQYGDRVCDDSCVESFVRPSTGSGYFNFEFNCGGTLHASYITDWRRTGDVFAERVMLPLADGAQVAVYPALQPVIDPEVTTPVTWTLGFFIPFSLLQKYAGDLGDVHGQAWTGNFYKCADACSHPHWAAWSPVDELNFHLPRCFGSLRFEG
jgi:hypothetical protein